jgi:hypothetical protein
LGQNIPLPLYHPTPGEILSNQQGIPKRFPSPLLTALTEELRLFLELPEETSTAKALPLDATETPTWSYEPETNEALYTLSQLAMMDFLITTPPLSPKTTPPSLDSTTSITNIEM